MRHRPHGAGPPFSRRLLGILGLGGILLAPGVSLGEDSPTDAAAEDTVGVRYEVGASSDFTNEQFYEDAFVDTTFLGRRRVGEGEARYAGVVFTSLLGTRARHSIAYGIENELSIGDKIQRGSLGSNWRDEFAPDWRFSFSPRIEYRHDQTFDRNLGEWRGAARLGFRRSFPDSWTHAELGAGADLLRTHGQGAQFLLDRNAGRVTLGLERAPLFGSEWRLDYGLAARSFPDSAERSHIEHEWNGSWRRDSDGGHWLEVSGEGSRRITFRPAPTSRDNFWRGTARLEAETRLGPSWSWRPSLEGELFHYDREDTLLFFNYRIARSGMSLRFVRPTWSIGLGPEGEALFSRGNHSEEYRQIGGALVVEYMGRGAWLTLTPSAGWRDYPNLAARGEPAIHSPYAYYDLEALGDAPVAHALRLRLYVSARAENHIDSGQDAHSLFFSIDLRKSL